jgi:tRNA-splicing endonuclease subunit Sen2
VVLNRDHSLILWRRGCFGKGGLSRSEPSWLERQINSRKGGGKRQFFLKIKRAVSLNPDVFTVHLEFTSEEITTKRRAERRQFKEDRARAIAAVAEEAEAIFVA